eukprot:COSAG05_NODE_1045_length_6054_cov_5.306969_3_plen_37_part_00
MLKDYMDLRTVAGNSIFPSWPIPYFQQGLKHRCLGC